MSKSFPSPSKTFFILFFLHLFLSLGLRLTGQLEQRIFNEILIYGALAYSMIGSQWNYAPSYLKASSILFFLYLLSIYTLQDFSNNGLSASEALEWGTTLFAFFPHGDSYPIPPSSLFSACAVAPSIMVDYG